MHSIYSGENRAGRRVQERKEALMRIRVQVIIESDQETAPPQGSGAGEMVPLAWQCL